MLNYLDTKSVLFTRGVSFDLKQYLYVVQVVLGEDKSVAYGMTFDRENFVKAIGSEDEDDYLSKVARDAEIMLQQQECQQLHEVLSEEYQLDIQAKASTLENYKFSGAEVQQLLANLLHNRTARTWRGKRKGYSFAYQDDVQGALDSGDTFQKHFITIHDKFNALCPNCNHEIDVFAGVDCVCQYCKQVFKWSEEERRFYPQSKIVTLMEERKHKSKKQEGFKFEGLEEVLASLILEGWLWQNKKE